MREDWWNTLSRRQKIVLLLTYAIPYGVAALFFLWIFCLPQHI